MDAFCCQGRHWQVHCGAGLRCAKLRGSYVSEGAFTKYFLECKCSDSAQDDEITVLMQLPEQDNLYLVCIRPNMLHTSDLAVGLLRGCRWQIPRGIRPLPLQAQTTRHDQAVVRTLLQVVDTRALPQITLTTDDARRLSVREPIQPRVFKSAWAFP